MRILCVDDRVENLYLLEKMLQGFGYAVVSARDGADALQQLERGHFDLIISDILMPQMDGFEFCYEVKLREALRDIPFIFYTATYTEKKDEELGLGLGASRFIVKPIEPEHFQAVIGEVVRAHEAGRLPVAQPVVAREEVFLRAYNRRLVRKITRKVEQLEQTTRQLRAVLEEKNREVAERQRAEAQVRVLNDDLEQRVRQRTAELAASNQDLQTFASAVSHDLRAPLRAIEGYGQILAQTSAGKLDQYAASCLDGLRSETRRMDRLIAALLQLSRATRAELRHERVDLSRLASEIETGLRRAQPDRSVEFKVAPGLMAQGDPALLQAALQNLLANAWKFTDKSSKPRIEFGRIEQEGQPVYFVRDNGVGFDMESADRLFAPFYRLHDAREFPGTGIGLATVQQIIRRHGGRVWAEGVAGHGATFYFTLN